jgi:hypothetical protein
MCIVHMTFVCCTLLTSLALECCVQCVCVCARMHNIISATKKNHCNNRQISATKNHCNNRQISAANKQFWHKKVAYTWATCRIHKHQFLTMPQLPTMSVWVSISSKTQQLLIWKWQRYVHLYILPFQTKTAFHMFVIRNNHLFAHKKNSKADIPAVWPSQTPPQMTRSMPSPKLRRPASRSPRVYIKTKMWLQRYLLRLEWAFTRLWRPLRCGLWLRK